MNELPPLRHPGTHGPPLAHPHVQGPHRGWPGSSPRQLVVAGAAGGLARAWSSVLGPAFAHATTALLRLHSRAAFSRHRRPRPVTSSRRPHPYFRRTLGANGSRGAAPSRACAEGPARAGRPLLLAAVAMGDLASGLQSKRKARPDCAAFRDRWSLTGRDVGWFSSLICLGSPLRAARREALC